MIVCSCNVLSDDEVRAVASAAVCRTPSHVYGCLGCKIQCGRCAHTIRKIMDELPDRASIDCLLGKVVHSASEEHL
jgi:bacterioferritin-associated ferredoxin